MLFNTKKIGKGACYLVFFVISIIFNWSASAFTTQWKSNEYSKIRVRLVDVQENTLHAILEMHLNDGWYTYYKNPGDLGMPTKIKDLNGNKIKVYWTKYDIITNTDFKQKFISNVYKNLMVLPIELNWPLDEINLEINYAVCKNVCVPLSMILKFNIPYNFSFDEENKSFLKEIKNLIITDEEPDHEVK